LEAALRAFLNTGGENNISKTAKITCRSNSSIRYHFKSKAGLRTAIDLVFGEISDAISMVFVASGITSPTKILNGVYSTPLIKFINRIEKLKTESKT